MSQLSFGVITVNSAESLKINEKCAEPSSQNSLEKIPVHKSAINEQWSLPTLLVSVEATRPESGGTVYKDVTFTVECSELSFLRTYETKLKLFDGSLVGWAAEMVSVEGKPSTSVPGGSLKILIKSDGAELPEKIIPLFAVS